MAVRVNLRKRDELVEHTTVKKQQHAGGVDGVLHGKESFRSVVALQITHTLTCDMSILLTIRSH